MIIKVIFKDFMEHAELFYRLKITLVWCPVVANAMCQVPNARCAKPPLAPRLHASTGHALHCLAPLPIGASNTQRPGRATPTQHTAS
jgi:hypothetical protein